MQQQLGQLEEDLKKAREQLAAVEEEKYRAFDELGEMKRVAEEANMRLSEALHAQATDPLSSRVDELEKASIESAKKRDQAWQLELEAVQKQHKLDLQTLSTTSRELDRVSKELAMALEELKMPSLQKEEVEDPEKEEMLKGSIFDADVIDSPIAFQVPQHTPPLPSNHHHHHHHRRTSSISAMTEDEDAANLEDLDHLDDAHLDTAENDRSTQRKKKALLRRFGELIRKTSFHRREPSIGQCQGV